MKQIILIIAIALLLFACNNQAKEKAPQDHSQHTNKVVSDTTKGSPKRMAMANVGKAHVHIEYNSPAVRKRIIWGGLVPLGEVWVTGAHNATSISFSDKVKIAGKTIQKGKYAFFTIPNKEEWTLILNKNWEQHLTDEYSDKDDILRWKVKPDSTEHTERLTYEVISKGKKGSVEMRWEKIKILFEIEQ
jgi:hypothetical protein